MRSLEHAELRLEDLHGLLADRLRVEAVDETRPDETGQLSVAACARGTDGASAAAADFAGPAVAISFILAGIGAGAAGAATGITMGSGLTSSGLLRPHHSLLVLSHHGFSSVPLHARHSLSVGGSTYSATRSRSLWLPLTAQRPSGVYEFLNPLCAPSRISPMKGNLSEGLCTT